jgi:hypothetical protein
MRVRSKRWWVIGSKQQLLNGLGGIDLEPLAAGPVFEDGPRVFARGDIGGPGDRLFVIPGSIRYLFHLSYRARSGIYFICHTGLDPVSMCLKMDPGSSPG